MGPAFFVLLSLGSAASIERLYRQGVLPSGKSLRGQREAGPVEGALAACATCHRRSGLGSWEGQVVIPPITGRFLFHERTGGSAPYTDATLARAIRSGVASSGRRLGELMPRYELDDTTMAALLAYLKTLTSGPVPGVDGDTLHFATIITPDADPVARRGMLDVLQQFFADKNAGLRGDSPALQSTRGVMYRVTRRWTLHVWQLTGPPASWGQQLERKLEATPVFAAISGLGGQTWSPIHRFCEQHALPCLFPNVDLPVNSEDDFYSVYFSRAVLLEAELIAAQLAPRQRVVQVFRPNDIGAAAATALAHTPTLDVVSRQVEGELQSVFDSIGPTDTVVLWLRPSDLAALPTKPPSGTVYVSGLMGSLEHAPLPEAWREVSLVTYPFDLPEQRQVRMNFPLGWFKVRQVSLVNERVQTDTWLSCVILAELLGHMLESFVRDYLLERVEMLLSHRLVNGYYPRLGLAPGQRFASKGGYLVHLLSGAHVAAATGWVVP